MDSFELNKIIGAILGTLLFVMGVGFVAEAIYSPIEDRGPGYSLPEPEGEGGAEPAEPEAPAVPLSVLLASANVEQGQNAVRKCQSCHNFGEGEANKQGPLLYDVVGRPIASHEGFSYSKSMAALGAAGEAWTYENLDKFLTAPNAFAQDTKMKFPGVKSPEERANILAYLATLSANPVPFPPPEAAPTAEVPAAEAAPATTETPAAPATEAPAATPAQ
ncbi:MAG: c-type cytochrome [Devosia sp.]